MRLARKKIELSLYPEIIPLLHQSGPLKGYTNGTSERLDFLTKAYAPPFWDFASNTFEEFNAMDHFQKVEDSLIQRKI